MPTAGEDGANERFAWFEYPDRDFPFYDGIPASLSGRQWLIVIAAVVLGFAALVGLPSSDSIVMPLVKAILFSAIPLTALAAFAGPHWTSIFYPLTWRDFGWMVVFWLLNMAVTAAVAYPLMKAGATADNAVVSAIAQKSGFDLAIFFGVTGIQLFGEEVFSILPFLALLWLLHTRFGFERKPAIVCAWVGCAIWFGAAHLPTYHWNFIQCFAVIGLARIVLLLAYLKTKNILVSFGAHLLTDWGIFVFALISAGFGGKVP